MTSIQHSPAESLEHLCSITGLSKKEGRQYLNVCQGNVQVAIGMYYDSDSSIDGIRAPIPQRTERLLDDNDNCHNDNTEREENRYGEGWEMLEIQFLWAPLDLIFRGSFRAASEHAAKENKWLLVNVQNTEVFSCHELNRDIWNNEEVKKIIEKYFVFWQVDSESKAGTRFIQFYKAKKWPYACVIDPRTGENVLYCRRDALVNGNAFCHFAMEFLACNETPEDEETFANKKLDGIADEVSKLTLEDCLGPSSDPITKLLLRLPTGERRMLEWPCSSKLRALFIYVEEQGYREFDIVTTFPNTVLNEKEMDEMTLLDAKFHPQQTLFVNQY